jgi:hypothetical protein
LGDRFAFSWHIHREGILSSVSIGVFLILVGSIFFTTPSLVEKTLEFFKDFTLRQVPHFEIQFPAPKTPETHLTVYSAAEQFSLIWGIFQVLMLALRFILQSPSSKKAETASNVVYWFGSAYLIQTMLVETTKWFEFWALVIVLAGFALIVRAIFLAITSLHH